MLTTAKKTRFSPLTMIFVVLCLVLLATATALAQNGYKAYDDANDNPDGLQWWFAPDNIYHRGSWYDFDQPGAMDQVVDSYLRWRNDVTYWWNNQPDRNYVHEVRTSHLVYEANSWYWTDLPTANHNEDSIWAEEQNDGFEEKELGWGTPATQIPGGVNRVIHTGFNSLNNGNTYFEMESELTRPSPWGGDWSPERWDVIGRMNIVGAD